MSEATESKAEMDEAAKGRVRAAVTALAAGLLYGSWAAYANWGHGTDAAVRPAIAQSLISVTATLALVLILEKLFRMAPSPRAGFVAASVGTSVIGIAMLAGGHAAAGTPEIWLTIAPSALVGTIFYFFYSAMLLRKATASGPRP
jgi:hypothetical protein